MDKPAVIISSCIMGYRCRYHGKCDTSLVRKVEAAADAEGVRLVPACAEMLGGLPCPRPPARRHRGRILLGTGPFSSRADGTEAFQRGAARVVEIAMEEGAIEAWLFWRSPSCDPEYGIAALALREAGVSIRGWGFPGIWRVKDPSFSASSRLAPSHRQGLLF